MLKLGEEVPPPPPAYVTLSEQKRLNKMKACMKPKEGEEANHSESVNKLADSGEECRPKQ